MIGVSRQRVHQLTNEDPTFPAPSAVLSAGGVWERRAIEEWAERTGQALRGATVVRPPGLLTRGSVPARSLPAPGSYAVNKCQRRPTV